MGAAGNGAFAGEHRAGRKVGTIGERHGAFRKEISRTVPAVAGLLLCALARANRATFSGADTCSTTV